MRRIRCCKPELSQLYVVCQALPHTSSFITDNRSRQISRVFFIKPAMLPNKERFFFGPLKQRYEGVTAVGVCSPLICWEWEPLAK